MERELAADVGAQGLPPPLRNRLWSAMQELLKGARTVREEVSDENYGRIAATFDDAPTPHVHPGHHSILKRINESIVADNFDPRFDVSGLARRTTVSTGIAKCESEWSISLQQAAIYLRDYWW